MKPPYRLLARLFRWMAEVIRPTEEGETPPGQILPGIEKPTTTLAHLLALEILENIDVRPVSLQSTMYSMGYKYVFPSCVINTETESNIYTSRGPTTKISSVIIDSRNFDFDFNEKSVLLNAIIKAGDLRMKKDRVDAENKKQDLALELIEKRMGIKSKRTD
jgi:hypothetical protein